MERLGRASEEARDRELRSLTVGRAAQVLEGLLTNPLRAPRRGRRHPVSLSRRMKKRHA